MVDIGRTRAALGCAALLVLLSSAARAQELAPHLDHQPISKAVQGEPVVLRAIISSPIGRPIAEPTAFVRLAGVTRFSRVAMTPDATVRNLFHARLPEGLISGDFDYYLEAFDADGNGPARAGSPEAPFRVTVAAPAPKLAETPAQQVRTILVTPAAPPPEPRSHALTGVLAFLGGSSAGVGLVLQLQVAHERQNFADAQAHGWGYDTGSYKDLQTMSTISAITLSAGGALLVGALASALWPEAEPPRAAAASSAEVRP